MNYADIIRVKLKASFTVENAVIVPIFFLMMVLMINLTLLIHDRIVFRNIENQVVIEGEIENIEDNMAGLIERAESYLKSRILLKDNADKLNIDIENSYVEESNPKKTFREVKAVKEILDKDD